MGTVITAMGSYARGYLPGGETLWHAVELAFSFCVITVLMGMIFRFLPELKIEWADVWLGASWTSLLFILGRFALGIYFARNAASSIFGAAGSLVIGLLWVYYSAQILLFGAKFTEVYALSHGSRQQESKAKKSPSPAEVPVTSYKAAPAPGGGRGNLIAVGEDC